MNLQEIFYILGIVTDVFIIIILLAIVVTVFYIKKKVTDISDMIDRRISFIKDAVNHPTETAIGLGAVMAETLSQTIKTRNRRK